MSDQQHVTEQRERYLRRLERLAEAAVSAGCFDVRLPEGGFYLWLDVGDDDRAAVATLAGAGVLVQPGSIYGAAGAGRVRLAAVRPDAEIDEAARRLEALRGVLAGGAGWRR